MNPEHKPNPLLDEPNIATPESAKAEYEQLKQKNRQRLIGAGAITLLVGGLFAAISGNGIKQNQTSNNAQTASAVSSASVPNTTEMTTSNEQHATASNVSMPLPETNTATASLPTPMLHDVQPTIASHTDTQTTAASIPTIQVAPALNGAPPAVQESHRRHTLEREASNTTDTTQTTQKRQEWQAQAVKAEAERQQRIQATAEQARKQEAAAIQTRQDERTRLAEQRKHQQTAKTKSQQANTKKTTQPIPPSGKFNVQAGAFATRTQADKVRGQLGLMGYRSVISEVKTAKGTLYRVQAVGFNSRTEAQTAASKMQANGLGGMILGR